MAANLYASRAWNRLPCIFIHNPLLNLKNKSKTFILIHSCSLFFSLSLFPSSHLFLQPYLFSPQFVPKSPSSGSSPFSPWALQSHRWPVRPPHLWSPLSLPPWSPALNRVHVGLMKMKIRCFRAQNTARGIKNLLPCTQVRTGRWCFTCPRLKPGWEPQEKEWGISRSLFSRTASTGTWTFTWCS